MTSYCMLPVEDGIPVKDISFFDCLSPFCFFLNWISLYLFIFFIKYYYIMFIIIVFWLGSGRRLRFGTSFSFVFPLLLSILTPLFLSSLFHYLISFLLFPYTSVGKTLCMSSIFPTALSHTYWIVVWYLLLSDSAALSDKSRYHFQVWKKYSYLHD